MHVGPAMQAEQQHIMSAVSAMEDEWPASKEALNQIQRELQEKLVQRWWNLAEDLIVHFSDGIYTHKNSTKEGLGYPAWWLQMIGFNNDFYKVQWVQHSNLPPAVLLPELPAALQPVLSSFGSFFLGLQALGTFFPGILVGAVLGGASVAVFLPNKRKVSDIQVALLE